MVIDGSGKVIDEVTLKTLQHSLRVGEARIRRSLNVAIYNAICAVLCCAETYMADQWIRLTTLADEVGYQLYSVKRALLRADIPIRKIRVPGRKPQDAVSIKDAARWKASLSTAGVR